MAGAITDIANELKTQYPRGSWEDMFNVMAPHRQMLRKCPYKPNKGGTVNFPARMSGAWNVGIIADTGNMPASNDPTTVQFSLSPVLFVAGFKLGLVAKNVAVDQDTTFMDGGILADRVETTSEQLAKYINIIYSGANRTRIAMVSADGANTFTLSTTAGTSNYGSLLLKEGMVVDVYDAHTSGSVRDSITNRRISAINESTLAATYSGADQTAVSGDHVYVYGTYSLAPFPLDDIVDDGNNLDTLQGQSRTTYPRLKANIFGNGGTLRDISEQLLMEACVTPRRRAGKNINIIMANDGQSRKIAEFIGRDRRFIVEPTSAPKYSMGYDEKSFRIFAPGVNAKYVENPDIQGRKIYALSWDTFMHYSAMDLDWWEDGGMLKPIPGSGIYAAGVVAYMASIENQGCTMPIANSRIDDLKDPIFGD